MPRASLTRPYDARERAIASLPSTASYSTRAGRWRPNLHRHRDPLSDRPIRSTGIGTSRGALRSAATAVADASDGVRHYTLCKEAFGLARLGLGTHEIEGALLPAFVAAAGERREAEGRRTIADAVRARKGAA